MVDGMTSGFGDDNSYRLSDAEREVAMSALSRAFAEGRLGVEDYDRRVQKVANAQFDSELSELFDDLPASRAVALPGMEPAVLFSGDEIDAARQNGRNTRLGLLGLTVVGSIAAAVSLDVLAASSFGALFFLLIPTVWLLLYVLKVGPDGWYTPSPRQLHRMRMRELRAANRLRAAEQRQMEQERLAGLRIERKRRTNELTNRALGYVNNALDNRNPEKRGK